MAEELLKHYAHVSALGSGSFGAALLMRRVRDNTLVVAKEIRYANLKERDRRSALNEVDILQSLQHPNIVRYIEKFQDASMVYIVMEYCDNGDLAQKIAERKGVRFSEAEVLDYFAQICLALRYLHDNRILHRDLKSQNVFLTSAGVVKLGDFGISAVLRNTFELRMTVCGTPYYFSPELCQNKPYNNKSDIWALGCILYELLTLRRPFTGSNMTSLAQRIRKGEYVPIDSTHYSPILVKLVAAMLHTNPHERPTVSQIFGLQTMRAAVARLRARLEGAAVPVNIHSGNASLSSSSSACTNGSNNSNSNGNNNNNNNGNGVDVGSHAHDANAAAALPSKSSDRAAAAAAHVVAVAQQQQPQQQRENAVAAEQPLPAQQQQQKQMAVRSEVDVARGNNSSSSNNQTTSNAHDNTASSSSSSSSATAGARDAGGLTRKQREQLQRQFVQVAAYANGLTLEQFGALDANVQVRVVCAAINAQKAAVHAQWEQRAAAAQREREKELTQQQQQLQLQQQQQQQQQLQPPPSSSSSSPPRHPQPQPQQPALRAVCSGDASSRSSNSSDGSGSGSSSTSHSDVRSHGHSSSSRSSAGSAAVMDDAPLPLGNGHSNNNNNGCSDVASAPSAQSPPHATAAPPPPPSVAVVQSHALHTAARKSVPLQQQQSHPVATIAVPATHADPHNDMRRVAVQRSSAAPTQQQPQPAAAAAAAAPVAAPSSTAHARGMPLMHRIELLRVELERAMGEEQLSRCYRALRTQQQQQTTMTTATSASMPAAWQRFVPLVQQLIAYERDFDHGMR